MITQEPTNMSPFATVALNKLLPVVFAFVLGIIVAWKGCGGFSENFGTTIIQKPTYRTEYIDRWQTDTVRFAKWRTIRVTDTVNNEVIVNRLDTLFIVDTVSIVEAWLTELIKYDTVVALNGVNVALKWQNYQNLSEQLSIEVSRESTRKKSFALGVHGNIGLLSDFKTVYKPLFGIGLQSTIKRTYFGADYGFNGDHYVGVRVGRNFINK